MIRPYLDYFPRLDHKVSGVNYKYKLTKTPKKPDCSYQTTIQIAMQVSVGAEILATQNPGGDCLTRRNRSLELLEFDKFCFPFANIFCPVRVAAMFATILFTGFATGPGGTWTMTTAVAII